MRKQIAKLFWPEDMGLGNMYVAIVVGYDVLDHLWNWISGSKKPLTLDDLAALIAFSTAYTLWAIHHYFTAHEREHKV